MFKHIKEKLLNAVTSHSKLVTLGIGLAVTFVIGTAIGIVDHSAFAIQSNAGFGSFSPGSK
jgi:hypothetical protein